jgi:hypothetical protein
MTYFKDLTDYTYTPDLFPAGNNIGWLGRGHAFPTATPDEETLDLLWLFCSISVMRARGFHICEFCLGGGPHSFERKGQRLSLGSAEIRVFSWDGRIYAAPNLSYHYVAAHHYRPPDEFLDTLRRGPRPPNQEYFDLLAKRKLEWCKTSKGPPANRVYLSPRAGPEERTYLEPIRLRELENIGLELEEGLTVPFCCYDNRDGTTGERIEDYLLFEGTVHFDSEKKKWYAVVDEKSYRRESELMGTL